MMVLDELISRPYLKMQRKLHMSRRAYGQNGDKWAGVVLQLALKYQAQSILDYGCGEGNLARTLRASPFVPIPIAEYDPAISGKDALPEPADLVNVTDVLEHIEPDRLQNVLQHLRSLARKAIWAVVALNRSERYLSDGRDTHLIIQHAAWWKHQFQEAGFRLLPPPTTVRRSKKEWAVVLRP